MAYLSYLVIWTVYTAKQVWHACYIIACRFSIHECIWCFLINSTELTISCKNNDRYIFVLFSLLHKHMRAEIMETLHLLQTSITFIFRRPQLIAEYKSRFSRVLTMVYNTRNCTVSGLCLLSGIEKKGGGGGSPPQTETDPVSETFCSLVFLEYQMMDKVQKPSNSEYKSSELYAHCNNLICLLISV
jgi:hypothetical protein